jgi:UTP--glucose-1-phosphate uridylyltransferase
VEFFQHKVPKVRQDTLGPVAWSADPDLEWCPPGHGDIYTALVTSGMLDSLLAAGYEYAFVSNADNLGAVVDLTILGFFVENQLPFMMEAAQRTEADKKGGHLAQLSNGQLILRELAQCPREDIESFQDTGRHKYFNTNNLWVNLPSLKAVMAGKNNILRLPMIRNAKTVDPRDSSTTPVYQLETAMGSAITVFEGAGAIQVPRARFAPVKTTNDLLAVRSDAYILTDDFQVISNPGRTLGQVVINLDPTYYKLVDDMQARFPHGVPSLIECKHLEIHGDIKFGRNISVKGRVKLANKTNLQIRVEDGTVLKGDCDRP